MECKPPCAGNCLDATLFKKAKEDLKTLLQEIKKDLEEIKTILKEEENYSDEEDPDY